MISFQQTTCLLLHLFLLIYSAAAAADATNLNVNTPDQFILEEIPVGSLIIDLADFLKAYESNTTSVEKISTTLVVSGEQQTPTTDQLEENLIQPAENSESSNEAADEDAQYFTFVDDSKSSNENIYFILDSTTGRLTSKRFLDRESMCMNKHCANNCNEDEADSSLRGSCRMSLKVLAIPSYKIVNMNIVVQDINDNVPAFRNEQVVRSVVENLPVGHRIPIDLAVDPDAGLNAVQTYTLVNSNAVIDETFSLQFDDSPDSLMRLYLLVKKKLDRETRPEYNLTIRACDAGVPKNFCGELSLVIHLIDQNDNNPIFEKSVYTFPINENTRAGLVVGKVRAVDEDEGLNGKITYTMLGSSDSSASFFDLNADSGVLTLKKSIDFEINQFFRMSIEARDSGVGSLPAYTTIEVTVVDENDNAPVVSVNFLDTIHRNKSADGSQTRIYLRENVQADTYLAFVNIHDKDKNTRLDWQLYVNGKELRSDDYLNYFKVNKLNAHSFTLNTGVKSNVIFDREKYDMLNVSIKGIDTDMQQRSTFTFFNFTIVLIDENDNAPQFDRELFALALNENNRIDDVIHQFRAVDLDLAENGQIEYSLEDAANIDFVYVEPKSGFLKAARVFDREKRDRYEFFILARDSPRNIDEQRTSRVRCVLSILDINDNRPAITYEVLSPGLVDIRHTNGTYMEVRFDENMSKSVKLVRLKCVDPDSGRNGETKLELVDANAGFGLSNAGELFVSAAAELDREVKTSFDLVASCRDNGLQKLNTSLKIRVVLNDLNDNCPKVIVDKADGLVESRFVSINGKNGSEMLVYERFYTDNDALGINSELQFLLESHADVFKLSVNRIDPKIFRAKLILLFNLVDMKFGKYVVKLRIRDSGLTPCVRNDYLVVYLADNDTQSERELIEKMKVYPDLYVNDVYEREAGDVMGDGSLDAANKAMNRLFFGFSSYGMKGTSEKISNSFLLTFIFIISVLVLAIVLLFFVLVFLCRSLSRKFKKSKQHRPLHDNASSIKVRNYSQVELNKSDRASDAATTTHSSRLNSSNSSDTNSDSGMGGIPSSFEDSRSAEIKNLLVGGEEKCRRPVAAVMRDADTMRRNRLSLSMNSSNESATGDSALSSLLYTREFSLTSSQDDNIATSNQCITTMANTTTIVNRYPSNMTPNTAERISANSIKVNRLFLCRLKRKCLK
jgi:hypothetical protein